MEALLETVCREIEIMSGNLVGGLDLGPNTHDNDHSKRYPAAMVRMFRSTSTFLSLNIDTWPRA
jgi:hypothetical protein